MKYLITLTVSFVSIISFGSNNPSYLPMSNGQQITHQYYSLSYNEETEQANWIYYKLTSEMLIGDAERNSNFRYDPLVTTKSASTKDYTKSGYDRGHLCPAADMKFLDKAMYESFYMSNVSPQVPEFNRGIWKNLESQVRDWTRDKDSIYVVTGPIFDESDIRIGNNSVKVPAYFYKVLYNPTQNQMIAFVLPNKASSLPFNKFASTVDSLEQITGIDFFSQLPDKLENRLESEIVLSGWFESPLSTSIKGKNSNNMLLILVLVIVGVLLIVNFLKKRK